MKKNVTVLNFLVFAKEIQKGVLQNELLSHISSLGFHAVEIRREYIKDKEKELPLIKQEAEGLGMDLFYSIPDEIYIEGTLNPKLTEYLEEAKIMGMKQIKLNIGEFNGELHSKELKALVNEQISIVVENDQTQTSGTIKAIKKYMDAVKDSDLTIGYVYDLGNWRFVGENEIEAVNELAEYVQYIHVKDVSYINNQPQVVGLDQGDIDWRKVLTLLPINQPIAIEYPLNTDAEILEAKTLLEEEEK